MIAAKILSQQPKRKQQRYQWKATLRSAPPLAFALLGRWEEQTRIFRWRWLAEAAALGHKLRSSRQLIRVALVEPYRPGANIVAFPQPADRGAPESCRPGAGQQI